MKPHITRNRTVWECRLYPGALTGYGYTPSAAFRDWKRYMDLNARYP